jgi:hypothetical protein
MDNMLSMIMVGAFVATMLIVVGVTWPTSTGNSSAQAIDQAIDSSRQYRALSMGRNDGFMMPIMRQAIKRAAKVDGVNKEYLKLLKQANWYWGPGEPVPPTRKAPYWNLETLWGEKYIRASLWGGMVFVCVAVVGSFYLPVVLGMSVAPALLAALVFGFGIGFLGFTSPDSAVMGAAASRQRELSLEMGFRLGELRSDVLAGYTIQRALRNMGNKPGGPFVEELRRIAAVMASTKDEGLAMDTFMDRNSGNELVQEFANQIKMVTREGGEIAPALNVLTDAAQNRLRQQITQQGRKNLGDMSRPVGMVSMIVTFLLLIIPAAVSIGNMMSGFQ